MAVLIGTATDHLDFWDTLLDFLQNNPALVAAGQNWDVAWQHPTNPEIVLKGPGMSGDDQVLVGLRRRDNELSAGESVIDMAGMTGVIPSASQYADHVNVTPRRPLFFLDQNPMQYWIVANGRRFVVVLRISTLYQAGYAGLYLPYASPAAYPYPLFIGGTRGYAYNDSYNDYRVITWRAPMSDAYRHFVYPLAAGDARWYDSPSLMLDPGGSWRAGTYQYAGTVYSQDRFVMGNRGYPSYLGAAVPYPVRTSSDSMPLQGDKPLGYASIRERIVSGLNGEMPLTPITLMAFQESPSPEPVTYGVLDGVFSVPGEGNAAENIISLNGVDHLVVQNVQRTATSEYWALALE